MKEGSFTDGSVPSSCTNSFAGTFELEIIILALPFRLKSVLHELNNQEKELEQPSNRLPLWATNEWQTVYELLPCHVEDKIGTIFLKQEDSSLIILNYSLRFPHL